MDDVRLLQTGVMDADAVAEIGYRSLMAGKRVVIPGFSHQLQVFAIRFLPRIAVAKMAKGMLQRA